jgi:hypothetical protein
VRASLKAEVLAPQEDPRIAVSLTNTGDVPFRVDRDLVLGLRVFSPGLGAPADRWEHVGLKPRPDMEGAAARFVLLAPGKSVTREIELKTGFAVFWHATARYKDGTEGVLTHEYIVRLPQGSHPYELIMDYSLRLEDSGALRDYTGLDIEALGPFPDRVTALLTFQAGEPTPVGPVR